jgi:hypothetical protein
MGPSETGEEVLFLMLLLVGSMERGSGVELWESSEPEFFFRPTSGEAFKLPMAFQPNLS